MKLPFRQLPELQAGRGLLVTAPAAGGSTFFLTQMVKTASEQGLKTCYLGALDGSVWTIEMLQAGYNGFTAMDVAKTPLNINNLGILLSSSLQNDVVVIDNLPGMVLAAVGQAVLNPSNKPEAILIKVLKDLSTAVAQKKNRIMVGLPENAGSVIAVPKDHDFVGWRSMRIFPVIKTEPAFKGMPIIDNLTTIRLVRETANGTQGREFTTALARRQPTSP